MGRHQESPQLLRGPVRGVFDVPLGEHRLESVPVKRTLEQAALMHELLRELPLLENKAMRAGLHITCRAIQNAVRCSGWEAAGEPAKATKYTPNTKGFSP